MFPEKPMDPLTPKQWKKYNRQAGAIFALNNLVTPKRGLKYVIISITQVVTEDQHIEIAI